MLNGGDHIISSKVLLDRPQMQQEISAMTYPLVSEALGLITGHELNVPVCL